MTNLKVLGETNHYIVVYKDVGILSQKDETHDLDIITITKNYLKEKYKKPNDAYVGLVHRLDRPVGGPMVLAKSSKGASRLSSFMKEGLFKKKYYALVAGDIDSDGAFCDYIAKINQKAVIVDSAYDGAKIAKLKYKVIKKIVIDSKIATLVEVDLETGRYNQIRCQFANHIAPIIGDKKYGYQGSYYDIKLACFYLSFPDPVTKEMVSFENNPEGELWDLVF